MPRSEHTWPARPEHVGDARAEVAAFARRLGVPTALLDGIRLAVSEAVSNVVLHGYDDREPGPMTVCAEAENRHLTVTVRDEGRGVDARRHSSGAGLGLPLISHFADAVSLSPGREGHGTLVRMRFDFPG